MSDERRLRVLDDSAGEVARTCGKGVSNKLTVVAGEVGVSGIVKLCICDCVVSAGRLKLNSQLALHLECMKIQTYAEYWGKDSIIE